MALGMLGVPAAVSAAEAPGAPESLRISTGPYAGYQGCGGTAIPTFSTDGEFVTFAATPADAPQPQATATLEAGKPGEEPIFRKSDTSGNGYVWSFGVPKDTFAPGDYQFRVRQENGAELSPWSSWCTFKVTTSVPQPQGAALSPDGGKFCLDVNGGGTADGTKVQLWECNGTPAQQWGWTGPNELKNPQSGKCLDVTAAGTANGTKVQLYTCNLSGAQRWDLTDNNAYLNPNSGKCLDVPSSGFFNGNGVQIYDCNGTIAQRWQAVAA